MKQATKAMTFFAIFILAISVCAFAWPVPDTGQTKCYGNEGEIPCPQPGEDFYGQDGNYSINPPSYTKLDVQGYDLPDSATEWGMVRDNVTGLIWEVKQAKDDIADYDNPHDADNRYTWYDSNPETNGGNAGAPGDGTNTEDFVNAINAEKFGGYSDWRMPTQEELRSIVDYGKHDPAINTEYFSNMTSSSWSSDSYAKDTGKAWVLEFDLGVEDGIGKAGSNHVFAVRDEQHQQSGNLLINGNGTVTDMNTVLMWQQQASDAEMTWKDAMDYCKTLSLGGYQDWHLPTIKELGTLAALDRYDPAIDTTYFPNALSSLYWSSSSHIDYTGFVWGLSLGYGKAQDVPKEYSGRVRAVRIVQIGVSNALPILTPARNSKWKTERTVTIKWYPQDISGSVRISLSRGGEDGTFETIARSTGNDGIYDWTVTGPASNNCVLKIESSREPSKSTTKGSFIISDPVAMTKKKAIILAGGGPGEWNLLWDATRRCADYAFRALTYQGYDADRVRYLSAGYVADMDAEATTENFEESVRTWAADANDLFIYMVDHGGLGTFRMNESEILEAETLDSWLDEVQQTIPGQVVILYDACHSGSFLPLLTPPPGKTRVVASSSESDEAAIFANEGTDSFSYRFFSHIFGGEKFYDSFVYAKKSIQKIYPQRPRVDADGNGVGSEDADIELAGAVSITAELLRGNDIPVIGKVSPEQTLEGKSSALLYAENVSDADGIDKVWATVMPPGCLAGSPDTPVTPPTIELAFDEENGRYEATYEGFTDNGTYTVAIYAVDKQGDPGIIEQTRVIQTEGKQKGDTDGDGNVNLADALTAFKAVCGMDISGTVRTDADVNCDGRIGIEEVIFVLQKIAGMR